MVKTSKMMSWLIFGVLALVSMSGAGAQQCPYMMSSPKSTTENPFLFQGVCLMDGTEQAWTGKHLQSSGAPGVYKCSCCGSHLYHTAHKYDSKTGWPSFWEAHENVGYRLDYKQPGPPRVEIYCKVCGAHLGHVFGDGPPPTGERHCVNSVCMDFEPSNIPSMGFGEGTATPELLIPEMQRMNPMAINRGGGMMGGGGMGGVMNGGGMMSGGMMGGGMMGGGMMGGGMSGMMGGMQNSMGAGIEYTTPTPTSTFVAESVQSITPSLASFVSKPIATKPVSPTLPSYERPASIFTSSSGLRAGAGSGTNLSGLSLGSVGSSRFTPSSYPLNYSRGTTTSSLGAAATTWAPSRTSTTTSSSPYYFSSQSSQWQTQPQQPYYNFPFASEPTRPNYSYRTSGI